MTIESHKQDFAVAFGIAADSITVVPVSYDGDPATLPKEDESDNLVRLPVAPTPPPEPTLEEKVAALLVATPAATQALAAASQASASVQA